MSITKPTATQRVFAVFYDGACPVSLKGIIHGRLADGTIVGGFGVFRQLYGAVGFSWVVALTRLPGLSHLLEWAYVAFAKRPLRLAGRCDSAGCRIDAASAHAR
jgi:hypothetical protein